ncbi:TolC family protein [Chryseobacterium sp. MDT2-18]|uniref:TolC family protein n=1 Tax=Chryseobacterium sp. MDT2-18 TaxID=1259136 RepID=UPI0027D81CF6|nr:TolC family protein [Chryseobacterium sp. MDT2-18]
MATIISVVMLFGRHHIHAQEPAKVDIASAYQLAYKNYPLIQQAHLIAKTAEYSVANAAKGYLPTLSINGQATYQSTVTDFPLNNPLFTLPNYRKDQYKIYGEINQVIYDGGRISNQKKAAKANETVQQQNLKIELYTLYDRINQLFFGAVIIDEQLKINGLLKSDIQNGIDKTKALVANGVAYRSNVDELTAQLLQAEQSQIELNATKKAYLGMLSLFINVPLDENSILEKPAAPIISEEINRPEILFYDAQKKIDDLQEQLLKIQLRPRLGFFVQGGYARPGLNPLSNDFSWYYIGGLRLNWDLGGLYTLQNQKKILALNKETLDIQKETFLFNTKISQKQQRASIEKYAELFKKDDAIIALLESVKKAAAAQLENGVLSAHDYINEVNAENKARQTRILHEIKLLQDQYNYQSTTGNIQTLNNQ